jgi:hypothetical protein
VDDVGGRVSVLEYTREEWQEFAETYAKENCGGVTFRQACRLVARGKYAGTVIEQRIRQFEWMLS